MNAPPRSMVAPATRNTLDLSAVPVLHEMTHLPVVVDPSHGTGLARIVPTMAMAAAAVGADGLIIEVHNDPQAAQIFRLVPQQSMTMF